MIGAQAGRPVGERYLFGPDGGVAARLADAPAPEALLRGLVPLERRPGPSAQHGVAYLPVLPRVTLLLVGAGKLLRSAPGDSI